MDSTLRCDVCASRQRGQGLRPHEGVPKIGRRPCPHSRDGDWRGDEKTAVEYGYGGWQMCFVFPQANKPSHITVGPRPMTDLGYSLMRALALAPPPGTQAVQQSDQAPPNKPFNNVDHQTN